MNILYFTLLTLFALQRLSELVVSNKNVRTLERQGHQIFFENDLIWLKLFHLSWFGAQVVEHFWMPLSIPKAVWILALLASCAGQMLRGLSQMALGQRWVIPAMANQHRERVTTGIYHWHAHPNYLGVALEIFALPLLGGAIFTCTIYGFINILIVGRRINQEEQILRGKCAT